MTSKAINHYLQTILVVALVFGATAFYQEASAQSDSWPFMRHTADYLGVAISRGKVRSPGGFDHYLGSTMPTILYDRDEPNPQRRFKMWFSSSYDFKQDLPPYNLLATDRVYYSESPDGRTWTTPIVVLKGQGGLGSSDAADDTLVGAPSVLKLNGKYYMFYEAYGNWVSSIARFFHRVRVDNWITNGGQRPGNGNWVDGYVFERNLGFAPLFPKPGTHPIYSGEVTYFIGRQNTNRFLFKEPVRERTDAQGRWRPLNRVFSSQGDPVFHLYNDPGPGRKAIYSCFDRGWLNNFATDDPGCEGREFVEVLGYAATDVNSPDLAFANQNRVALATSTDGVHWTRLRGAEPGSAMIAPQNDRTIFYPNTCGSGWDVATPAYGSGYPSALVRDGYLELYFTDDTVAPNGAPYPQGSCGRPIHNWRIRIPISQIENPQAYLQAQRQPLSDGYGGDIKWSPTLKRYFAQWTFSDCEGAPCPSLRDPRFRAWPGLIWSEHNPDPGFPPSLPSADPDHRLSPLPTNIYGNNEGRFGEWGGIIGDGLGHTLEDSEKLTIHMFYQALNLPFPQLGQPAHFADLDHLLVQLYLRRASVSVASVSGAPGQRVPLRATLKDAANQAPLAGRTLIFKVAGAVVGSDDTDSSGSAIVNYVVSSVDIGKQITVEYMGDEKYPATTGIGALLGARAGTNLVVQRVEGTIGRPVNLTAGLKENITNNPLSGKTLVFKVYGSVVGSAVTNSSGTATFSYLAPRGLSRGDNPVTVEFAGDNTHIASSGAGVLHIQLANNLAKYISQDVSRTMTAGTRYTVTVTMQNTGETGWRSANLYRLGSVNPKDNTTWGISRVELPATTLPGERATFRFTVTAPRQRGNHNFQWKMVEDRIEWFGELTPNLVIRVK